MPDVHLRNLTVLKQTYAAFHFRQKQRGGDYVDFWIPKSQIGNNTKYKNRDTGEIESMDISIPEWLFEKKEGVMEL